jgi:hypothetical protein
MINFGILNADLLLLMETTRVDIKNCIWSEREN